MQEQTTKQTKGKFLPKKKKTKKGAVIAAITGVAVLALLGLRVLGGKEEAPQLDLADTTILAYTDLQSTISASGIVESAQSTTVYSMVSYPVMAVHVKVGDYVEAGQLLAELDGKTLQNQIASQQIGLETAGQSGAQQVHTAQTSYENFKSGLDQVKSYLAQANAERTGAGYLAPGVG